MDLERQRRRAERAGGLAALLAILAVLSAGADELRKPPEAGQDPDGVRYLVQPGDVLQVFVWKEPDLSRDVMVRLDGKITMPLVGDLIAAGRTPEELGQQITEKLGRYVNAPQVTLGVAQPNSVRFFIVGEVLHPGAFPLTAKTTVVQALAQAGGFKEFAKPDRILIVRGQPGSQKFVPVNYRKLESGSDMSQNVVLLPGDTIVVP